MFDCIPILRNHCIPLVLCIHILLCHSLYLLLLLIRIRIPHLLLCTTLRAQSLSFSPSLNSLIRLSDFLRTFHHLQLLTPLSTSPPVSFELLSCFRCLQLMEHLDMCYIVVERYGCGSQRIVRRRYCPQSTSYPRTSCRGMRHWVRTRCGILLRLYSDLHNEPCHANCPYPLGQFNSRSHR